MGPLVIRLIHLLDFHCLCQIVVFTVCFRSVITHEYFVAFSQCFEILIFLDLFFFFLCISPYCFQIYSGFFWTPVCLFAQPRHSRLTLHITEVI